MRDKGSQRAMMKLIEARYFLKSINQLINPYARISEYHNWMPKSIHLNKEAELKNFLKYNFEVPCYKNIVDWWLHIDATTPNWDFISTCEINGKRGLLLVEAKAHFHELEEEAKGKPLSLIASENSKFNHAHIARAIEEANSDLTNKGYVDTKISRDACYQLSNRVAHAWWLASNGVPVVLLYLGFLNISDMDNCGRRIFYKDEDWQTCFSLHAKRIGANVIQDKWINCDANDFRLMSRSLDISDLD